MLNKVQISNNSIISIPNLVDEDESYDYLSFNIYSKNEFAIQGRIIEEKTNIINNYSKLLSITSENKKFKSSDYTSHYLQVICDFELNILINFKYFISDRGSFDDNNDRNLSVNQIPNNTYDLSWKSIFNEYINLSYYLYVVIENKYNINDDLTSVLFESIENAAFNNIYNRIEVFNNTNKLITLKNHEFIVFVLAYDNETSRYYYYNYKYINAYPFMKLNELSEVNSLAPSLGYQFSSDAANYIINFSGNDNFSDFKLQVKDNNRTVIKNGALINNEFSFNCKENQLYTIKIDRFNKTRFDFVILYDNDKNAIRLDSNKLFSFNISKNKNNPINLLTDLSFNMIKVKLSSDKPIDIDLILQKDDDSTNSLSKRIAITSQIIEYEIIDVTKYFTRFIIKSANTINEDHRINFSFGSSNLIQQINIDEKYTYETNQDHYLFFETLSQRLKGFIIFSKEIDLKKSEIYYSKLKPDSINFFINQINKAKIIGGTGLSFDIDDMLCKYILVKIVLITNSKTIIEVEPSFVDNSFESFEIIKSIKCSITKPYVYEINDDLSKLLSPISVYIEKNQFVVIQFSYDHYSTTQESKSNIFGSGIVTQASLNLPEILKHKRIFVTIFNNYETSSVNLQIFYTQEIKYSIINLNKVINYNFILEKDDMELLIINSVNTSNIYASISNNAKFDCDIWKQDKTNSILDLSLNLLNPTKDMIDLKLKSNYIYCILKGESDERIFGQLKLINLDEVRSFSEDNTISLEVDTMIVIKIVINEKEKEKEVKLSFNIPTDSYELTIETHIGKGLLHNVIENPVEMVNSSIFEKEIINEELKFYINSRENLHFSIKISKRLENFTLLQSNIYESNIPTGETTFSKRLILPISKNSINQVTNYKVALKSSFGLFNSFKYCLIEDKRRPSNGNIYNLDENNFLLSSSSGPFYEIYINQLETNYLLIIDIDYIRISQKSSNTDIDFTLISYANTNRINNIPSSNSIIKFNTNTEIVKIKNPYTNNLLLMKYYTDATANSEIRTLKETSKCYYKIGSELTKELTASNIFISLNSSLTTQEISILLTCEEIGKELIFTAAILQNIYSNELIEVENKDVFEKELPTLNNIISRSFYPNEYFMKKIDDTEVNYYFFSYKSSQTNRVDSIFKFVTLQTDVRNKNEMLLNENHIEFGPEPEKYDIIIFALDKITGLVCQYNIYNFEEHEQGINSLPWVAWIFICLGGLLLLILIAFLIRCLIRRKTSNLDEQQLIEI